MMSTAKMVPRAMYASAASRSSIYSALPLCIRTQTLASKGLTSELCVIRAAWRSRSAKAVGSRPPLHRLSTDICRVVGDDAGTRREPRRARSFGIGIKWLPMVDGGGGGEARLGSSVADAGDAGCLWVGTMKVSGGLCVV